ncbi:MAG: helix-turn-helix domain-containing protein [Gammaproteobacteria bacterium]|nr:helix-turn-helix domain-containing protein [Gammaproteobacteria bacterium]
MNDIINPSLPEPKPITSFGGRLQSAREGLGLERKDAAEQLRLSEKIIIMMEKDRYPPDLPVTFIRGYLRSYGKLLQIPDFEVKKAIEPIKQKSNAEIMLLKPQYIPVTSSNSLMQFLTGLIFLTLLGLVGAWWYTKSPLHLIPEHPIIPVEVAENTAAAILQIKQQDAALPTIAANQPVPNTPIKTIIPGNPKQERMASSRRETPFSAPRQPIMNNEEDIDED